MDNIFLEQSGKTWLPSYQHTKQQLGIIKHWLFVTETSIVQKKKIMFAMQRLQQAKYNISVLKAFRLQLVWRR